MIAHNPNEHYTMFIDDIYSTLMIQGVLDTMIVIYVTPKAFTMVLLTIYFK